MNPRKLQLLESVLKGLQDAILYLTVIEKGMKPGKLKERLQKRIIKLKAKENLMKLIINSLRVKIN